MVIPSRRGAIRTDICGPLVWMAPTLSRQGLDNSGNRLGPKAVSVTSTTGSTPPYTNILYPQEVVEANATVVDGVIQKVNIKRKGKHHMELPEIEAVEDLQPWNLYNKGPLSFNSWEENASGFRDENNGTGPGPGGEELVSKKLSAEGGGLG